jgi:hypothetical protein
VAEINCPFHAACKTVLFGDASSAFIEGSLKNTAHVDFGGIFSLLVSPNQRELYPKECTVDLLVAIRANAYWKDLKK